MTSLHALLAQQSIAVGMVSAAVLGSLAYSLKAIPMKLWGALKDLFSTTLVVDTRDELYRHLCIWLARSEAAQRTRRLMVQEEYDYEKAEWAWRLTLGLGWHLIWAFGRPVFLNRSETKASEISKFMGQGRSDRLYLISLGRSQAVLRKIVAEAEKVYNGDGMIRVHYWNGGHYILADRRTPRDLNTVFLPEEQKVRLVTDIQTFIAAKLEYRRRGTPYRRGYLFEGPPGTGKTSLIFALGGLLGRSVYVVNLACVEGDNDLLSALNMVASDGIVVIEDIDAAEITHERTKPPEPVVGDGAVAVVQPPAKRGITLSGLLNAIDGVAAREGRLLFVTSNHADKLDAALLRSGRIDVREVIAPLEEPEAWAMFRAFCPDGERATFDDLVAGLLPIPAAELQNLLQKAEVGTESNVSVLAREAA